MIDHPPAIERVYTDHGGNLFADRYRDRGQEVRILGTCESACTLWLGLPDDRLCVAPAAWLGFHAASRQLGTDILWAGYSASLKAVLGGLTAQVRYLRGHDLIAIGYRECPR